MAQLERSEYETIVGVDGLSVQASLIMATETSRQGVSSVLCSREKSIDVLLRNVRNVESIAPPPTAQSPQTPHGIIRPTTIRRNIARLIGDGNWVINKMNFL